MGAHFKQIMGLAGNDEDDLITGSGLYPIEKSPPYA